MVADRRGGVNGRLPARGRGPMLAPGGSPETRRRLGIMFAVSWLVLLMAPAVAPDDARDLPVVVLVGDSIRMGYAPAVAERLKGKARVVSPEENGGDSANVLEHLDAWVIAHKPA